MALVTRTLLACLLLVGGCKSKHEGAQTEPTKLSLDVVIAGERSTWGDQAFAAAPRGSGTNHSGDERDVWSLRDLVHANVGPTARVVSVTGAGGTQPVDAAAWADTAKDPILHSTRRGTLKFRWADPQGSWGPEVVKDVTAIEIVR